MKSIWQDLHYGFRVLRKSPLFTLVVICSLALGIGFNTAIFTFMNALFLKPIPVAKEPNRILAIFTRTPGSPTFFPVSYLNYSDYITRNRSCTALAAYQMFQGGLVAAGNSEPVKGELVSANYFDVLGIHPLLGRTFAPQEGDILNQSAVIVLSHHLWERRFARDPHILGQKLLLNGYPFTIIGVTPKGYAGTTAVGIDLWVPLSSYRTVFPFPEFFAQRSGQILNVFGRLRQGVSVRSARQDFASVAAQLAKEYPNDNRGQTATVLPLSEASLPPEFRPMFQKAGILLMAAVGLLLLMGCANVANLLLAKSLARAPEIAIRLSLGAGRSRLVRQLLTESLILSVTGGMCGLLVAKWSRDLLWKYRPPFFETSSVHADLDARALLFTLAVSLLTGLLFGMAPALAATNPNLAMASKQSSKPLYFDNKSKLRDLFLMAQIFLCFLSLGCTGLFLQSLYKAQHIDPGFDTSHILVFSFDLRFQGYNEAEGRKFQQRLLAKASSFPSVRSAAIAENRLLGGFRLWENIYPHGRDSSYREGGIYSGSTLIGPNYFETVGIPLIAGRGFTELDAKDSHPVAVINETMARKLYPGDNPLGRTLIIEGEKEPVQIIGIARNSKYTTLGEDYLPFLYLPLSQRYSSRITLHVQLDGDPTASIPTLSREIHALDPSLPLLEARNIPEVLNRSLWAQTLSTLLLSLFSLVAIVLAALGVYGTTNHFVTRRAKEIGIRLALGADRTQVVKMVLKQSHVAVLTGLAAGLIATFWAKRLLNSFLYHSTASDLLALALIALLIAATAYISTLMPAMKASHIDPAISIRTD